MEAPNGVTLYKLCECEQEQKLVSDIRELSDYVIQLEIKAKTLKRNLERATKKAEKYEAFKIPNRYEYANIKECYEFLSCGVAQVIRDYLNEFKIGESGNLILVGATGTGKTYLAASMAKYIKSEWLIKVGMINAVNLIKLLKNFENKNEIKEVEKIASEIPLLIIDDVGVADTTTEWQREVIYDLINRRYENCLPTIITSNLTADKLEKCLGKATYSRLCEGGICIVLEGPDIRKLN